MMTPVFNHLLCFNLCRCTEKVRKLINLPVVRLLGTRVNGTSTEMITQCIYLKFPTTTTVRGFSVITWIWVSIDVEKNVCQRLVDQDSSLRWVLIYPSQLIALKKRTHLGESSSWDSRSDISIRSTESSTVDTMCCCESKLKCSTRRDPTYLILIPRI